MPSVRFELTTARSSASPLISNNLNQVECSPRLSYDGIEYSFKLTQYIFYFVGIVIAIAIDKKYS